ncbi:MAG: hypothetical protein J7M14_06315 [Planctomycetes bacterium]|nr:hypothetical protein [Planctomycetota bacterium]
MGANIKAYLGDIEKARAAGNATEHTYRPAFKAFVESFGKNVVATNEPKRVACGAPDFIVEASQVPVGYIECKDVETPLDAIQKTDQLKRYFASLENLILTDYLEFRYYVDGEQTMHVNLARIDAKGKVKLMQGADQQLTVLFDTFLAAQPVAINSPKELAGRMANVAKVIRDAIEKAFALEGEAGTLHGEYESFRATILGDLTVAQFADMYAQTVCYGMFSARVNVPDHQAAAFTREHAAYDLPNLGMHLCRQSISESWRHVLATNSVTDDCYVSNKTRERGYLFALYLYPGKVKDYGTAGSWPPGKDGRRPNLAPDFVEAFAAKLGLKFISDGQGNLKKRFGPEDVFCYAYAVFHSPAYRTRYAEFLKIDFPRLPLTDEKTLFARLVELGRDLVGLHLLERVPAPQATYPKAGDNTVRRKGTKAEPMYAPPTEQHVGRVYVNDSQYFDNVPPEVWSFHIGGYQVCEKWLKDRKGRTLSYDDIEHYRRMTEAVRQTLRLMEEIDQAIPAWPMKGSSE